MRLAEASRSPLLSREAERELVQMMADGDARARARLVVAHRPLAKVVARELKGTEIPESDLEQEGLLALFRTLDRFDPERDVRVATFARWCMRGAMLRAIEQHGRLVRLPRDLHDKLLILRRVRGHATAHYGMTLTVDQLVSLWRSWAGEAPIEFGGGILDPDEIEMLLVLEAGTDFFGLRQNDGAADEVDMAELLARIEERETVRRVVAGLDHEEREVIVSRFGLADREVEQLGSIAKRLGKSRAQVREIERRALANVLRGYDRSHGLGYQL